MRARLARSYVASYLRWALGLRPAFSSLTAAERALLAGVARGARCVVEVGVAEGVTSRLLAEAMAPDGALVLVDPYIRESRVERWCGVSFAERIARHEVRAHAARTRFVREASVPAAAACGLEGRCDLVFIDARHDYASVRADWAAWAPMLAPGAALAFHDSQPCAARPDLSTETGSVRFVAELAAGEHGAWARAAVADSLTVLRARR